MKPLPNTGHPSRFFPALDRSTLRIAVRDAADLVLSRHQSYPKEMTPASTDVVCRVYRRLVQRLVDGDL